MSHLPDINNILSIQSHVAYGYVGNRAAVPTLQALGCDVSAINTVQFSNHTGYGNWTGEIFSPAHIDDLLNGMMARGVLASIDALLTGYMGSAELGHVITGRLDTLRIKRPDMDWVCDPVMGDTGRGIFVHKDLPAFFRESAVPRATVMTPNVYELGLLTDMPVDNNHDICRACETLHARGPGIVLVTSVFCLTSSDHEIGMLLSSRENGQYSITTPRLGLAPAPNGAGDVTAALFAGHYLQTSDEIKALSRTADGIYSLFEATYKAGTRELALISSLHELAGKAQRFHAQTI
jgi:pyridoxine kinase